MLSTDIINRCKMLSVVNEKSHFSEWLAAELDKRGWRQSELVKRSGLTSAAVSNLVNGNRNPTAETCVLIARALDLPPETVLTAADLLPEVPVPDRDPTYQEILNVVKHMTPEERAELLDYALFRFRKRKK